MKWLHGLLNKNNTEVKTKTKLKQTSETVLAVSTNISNILVDITDVRKILNHESIQDLNQKLYNILWKEEQVTKFCNNILCTIFIEIPLMQSNEIFDIVNKISSGLKLYTKINDNTISFMIQCSITGWREYLRKTIHTDANNIYKLIIRTLYQTHAIYFTDMINEGKLVGSEFNQDYNNQSCNKIIKIDEVLYHNDITRLYTIMNCTPEEVSHFNYTINRDLIKGIYIEYIKDIYIDIEEVKVPANNINSIDQGNLYVWDESIQAFVPNVVIDEIIEDDSIEVDNPTHDTSESIKDFYRNGGVNIYEETDYGVITEKKQV